MDRERFITNYWNDVAKQNAKQLELYFNLDALIFWHDSNEQFTVSEFIMANCEYPGDWCVEIERVEQIRGLVITVTRVFLSDKSVSVHVVSFFEFENDKIASLNEYWGEDVEIPQWRLEKNLGRPIK